MRQLATALIVARWPMGSSRRHQTLAIPVLVFFTNGSPDLGLGLTVTPTSGYPFSNPTISAAGIGKDYIGSINLTPNNAPTYVAGPVTGTVLVSGDAVAASISQVATVTGGAVAFVRAAIASDSQTINLPFTLLRPMFCIRLAQFNRYHASAECCRCRWGPV